MPAYYNPDEDPNAPDKPKTQAIPYEQQGGLQTSGQQAIPGVQMNQAAPIEYSTTQPNNSGGAISDALGGAAPSNTGINGSGTGAPENPYKLAEGTQVHGRAANLSDPNDVFWANVGKLDPSGIKDKAGAVDFYNTQLKPMFDANGVQSRQINDAHGDMIQTFNPATQQWDTADMISDPAAGPVKLWWGQEGKYGAEPAGGPPNPDQPIRLGDPNQPLPPTAGIPGGGGGGGGNGEGAGTRDPRWTALYDELIKRSQQGLDVNANDPIIKGQVDAANAVANRNRLTQMQAAAERGGPYASGALANQARSSAESVQTQMGAMQTELMGREVAARRQEIAQALQQRQGILTVDEQSRLQQADQALQAQQMSLADKHASFQDALSRDQYGLARENAQHNWSQQDWQNQFSNRDWESNLAQQNWNNERSFWGY